MSDQMSAYGRYNLMEAQRKLDWIVCAIFMFILAVIFIVLPEYYLHLWSQSPNILYCKQNAPAKPYLIKHKNSIYITQSSTTKSEEMEVKKWQQDDR